MERIFEALASTPRRKILAYLTEGELSAGEIADRFDMSKPSLSKHLRILETAGLVASEKRGQFVYYRLVEEQLTQTLTGFLQTVCPVSRGLKREAAKVQAAKRGKPAAEQT
ncbi:metalloregulator ArsR/SmtB family transcription factor [Piscinibacterium candidicorallinum]|uniref:Metalloregulator ArsR/SmtB family transcription factor n=1 Tax=Piscinibacterium candidicorallinum TaxID=1793872 RepID=A0ABV7H4C0_9BURK